PFLPPHRIITVFSRLRSGSGRWRRGRHFPKTTGGIVFKFRLSVPEIVGVFQSPVIVGNNRSKRGAIMNGQSVQKVRADSVSSAPVTVVFASPRTSKYPETSRSSYRFKIKT